MLVKSMTLTDAASKVALLLTVAALTACSHTPTRSAATAVSPTSTAVPATESEIASTTAQPIPRDVAIPLDQVEAPEPQTAEEAVATAVAEENLLNRIRAGFAMKDADHINVDREVAWFARNPDYLDRTFRRAERYLYFIVEELEARKMPLELALLPIVESAFNPVALSKARAAGLWQFIPSTGRRYGLEQNYSYDGRRDVVESTRAALDYFQFLANEFDGNWYQAVAAYNSGEMNVSRAIARNQAKGKPTDFFSLDLPRETRAYVPKLLALRRIIAEPEKFGLEFGHMANQPYFAKVELQSPIDLGVAARLAGLPKEDLIALNPAFHRAVTSTDGSGYLLVPVERAEQVRAGLAALSPAQRVPKIYYTVHRGDTVSSVARKLGVNQDELRASNKVKGNALHVGQELVIDRGSVAMRTILPPDPASATRVVSRGANYVPPAIPPAALRESRTAEWHKVRSGETLWSIARMYGVTLDAIAEENDIGAGRGIAVGQKLTIPHASNQGAATLATNDARQATVQKITYLVHAGDTLSHIAQKFRVQTRELLTWNKLRTASALKAGQKLIIYVDDVRRSGG